MKRRGVVCVLVILLCAGVAGADEKEDADALFRQLLEAKGDDVDAAQARLVKMGASAVPRLVEALSSGVREDTLAASRLLGEIGKDGSGALDALLENLIDRTPAIRIASMRALVRIAEPDVAMRVVLALCRDPDEKVRQAALDSFAGLGAAAASLFALGLKSLKPYPDGEALITRLRGEDALPFLLALLEDPSWHLRQRILGLAYSKAEAPAAWIARLRDMALQDPSGAVRRRAASSLCWRVRTRPELAPVVEPLLGSKDHDVRAWAVGAMTWADSVSPSAERHLRDALESVDDRMRQSAALALRSAREELPETKQALRRRLEDHAEWVRWAAATTLVQLGERDAALAGTLVTLLRTVRVDPPYPIRYQHGRDLGGGMRAPWRDVRPLAFEALCALGEHAHRAAQVLLEDESEHVRRNAIHFLGRTPRATREILQRALTSAHRENRCAAACTLIHAGLPSPEAMDVLLGLLEAYEKEWIVPDPVISDAILWSATAGGTLEAAGADLLPRVFARVPHVMREDPLRAKDLLQGLRHVVVEIGEDAIPHLEAVQGDRDLGAWVEDVLAELRRPK